MFVDGLALDCELRSISLCCFLHRSTSLTVSFCCSISLMRDHPASLRRRCAINPLKPDLMSAAERIDELAEILARGLIRGRVAKLVEIASGDHRRWCSPSAFVRQDRVIY